MSDIDWNIVKKEAAHVRKFHDWMHDNHRNSSEGDIDIGKRRRYIINVAPSNKCLAGHCAIATHLLAHRLAKHGIKSEVAVGHFDRNSMHPHSKFDIDNHTWLHVGDKIVDVTATQFSNKYHEFKPVHITDKSDSMYRASKTGINAVKSIAGEWPDDQKLIKPVRKKLKDVFYPQFRKQGFGRNLPEGVAIKKGALIGAAAASAFAAYSLNTPHSLNSNESPKKDSFVNAMMDGMHKRAKAKQEQQERRQRMRKSPSNPWGVVE